MADEIEKAKEVVRKILSGVPLHDNSGRVIGDHSHYTDDFFADPSDREAIGRAAYALMRVEGMNPRTPKDHPVYQQVPELLEARMSGPFGYYSGGGWSPEEREAFKQRTGRHPDGRDLSPGDRMVYGRQLDHDTILAIANGMRLQHTPSPEPTAGFEGFSRSGGRYGGSQAQAPSEHVAGLGAIRQAISNYEAAQGKQGDIAFGLMGSVYPQHQGWNAVRDAVASGQSYIGNFLGKGQFTEDAAAHSLLSPGVDPLNRAAVTYEGNYHWGAPSPSYVPGGLTAEQRDAHIEKARKLVEETRPPTYSMSYMREHGVPPSYAGQGMAYGLNLFSDLSLPATLGAGKVVNMTAKGAARTGLPLVSRYGAHIANKTAPIAAASPGAFAVRESMEDAVPMAGMMGLQTYGQDTRPSFFFPGLRGKPSAWKSGLENRPDLRAALLAEGVRLDPAQTPSRAQMLSDKGSPEDYFSDGGGYDQKMQRSERAAKELAAMNRQSPESFDKSSAIGRAGATVGDFAGQLMGHTPPPPKEQPKYLPPAWGPWGFR